MKKCLRKVVYNVAIGICIILFCTSTISILFLQYSKVQDEKIIQEVQRKKEEVVINNEKDDTQEKTILKEYQKLYKENNDLYGWIKIDKTSVNYPVMYTPNNPDFYERRNWKKKSSILGSIYVSGEVRDSSENIIIYGHDTRGTKMFGSLKSYKNPDYYKKHKYIQFDTLYERQTYEIISVSKAVVYYNKNNIPKDAYLFYEHIELDTEKEFNSYIEYVKQNSWYDIDVTASFKDQLITLCTCNFWTKDGRLLIVAKKI